MDQIEHNQLFENSSINYLEEQINLLKSMLSNALNIPFDDVKVSFPTLENFYFVNKIYKSSWAIYTHKDKLPKLLFTGNFIIQGGPYTKRSSKSPFGAEALSSLTSIANTFSIDASYFKQNWTYDLNLLDDDELKLKFSVKDYQYFLKVLNTVRAKWLLHLSEEGNFDFVIVEFSEPSDPIFFIDLENFDSNATKVKTYFKPISQGTLNQFQSLSANTEFEGKFFNLQPGTWLRDDVLIELEKFYSEKFFDGKEPELLEETYDYNLSNPFKVQALR